MQFWLIFAQIWLPWQPLNSLENSGSIFEFTKPIKPTKHAKNSLIFARNRNLCNLGLYFSEFGCHGNSLGYLENCNSIFEVADPKSWLFMRKIPRYLAQNWNQCNFSLFLFKFGYHGNSLGSLDNWDSIFEVADSFSCKKFIDFLQTTTFSAILPYFCSNLVAMATPLAPLKILIAY